MNDFGKAKADDYSPSPFFFVQLSQQAGRRIVVWSHSADQLRRVISHVIESFGSEVRILLKIQQQSLGEDGTQEWTRYYGTTKSQNLIQGLDVHAELIFRDGSSQLCIKDGEYDEYFALDEHSILYIYSDDPAIPDLLREEGFTERFETLISEVPHFRHSLGDSDALRTAFIKEYGLQPVEGKKPITH